MVRNQVIAGAHFCNKDEVNQDYSLSPRLHSDELCKLALPGLHNYYTAVPESSGIKIP